MKFNSKEFLALRDAWYDKARLSGFEDIEKNDRHENLKKWSSRFLYCNNTKLDLVQIENKRDYYMAAEHFMYSYQFESAKEMLVWMLHANGIGILSITKILKEVKIKISKDGVQKILKNLGNKMLEAKLNERNDD